jgi:hypothetical protein
MQLFRLLTSEEKRLASLGCCFLGLAALFHVLAAWEREATVRPVSITRLLMDPDGRIVSPGWNAAAVTILPP